MKAARKFFAPTSSGEMVKLLNHGVAPGSSAAKQLVLSTGQFRSLVVWSWVLALQLAGLATVVGLWAWGLMPDMITASEFAFPAFLLSILGMFMLSTAVFCEWLGAYEVAFGKTGCLRWTRALNSSPRDCQQLLNFNSMLDGTAVQAVNRPLYLADLAWAEERWNLRREEELEAKAAAESLNAQAAQEELAAACAKVHALVKTTT